MGVPLRVPVVVLKFKPGGSISEIVKEVAFLEVGVKVYWEPIVADVAGVPLIVGSGIGLIVISNAGSDVDPEEFTAVITMLLYVPVAVGIPLIAPVEVLKISPGNKGPT